MLYISRRISANLFGVIDTDDNTEELCTRDELYNYYVKLGIDIKGVTFLKSSRSTYVTVDVYNANSSNTTAKLKFMYGINLQVDANGCLVKLDAEDNWRSCTVRLSDYVTSLESYSVTNIGNGKDTVLTLVFDDKLQSISPKFLQSAYVGSYLRFDISELTGNKSAVAAIYKNALPSIFYSFEPSYVFANLVDTDIERRDFYLLKQVVNMTVNDKALNLSLCITDLAKANKKLEKVLLREFRSLPQCQFYYNNTFIKREGDKSCRRAIFAGKIASRLTTVNVQNPKMYTREYILAPEVAVDLLNDINRICTVNRNCLARLCNYIKLVNMSKEITEIYYSLAVKYLNWIFNEYKIFCNEG